MKKLSLFALAAAGLLLGACSDKDTVNEVVQTPDFTDGAFIGISIQMPSTTATTRANEDFKDGDANEWEVKDANLLIFVGADEASATWKATYALGKPAVLDPAVDTNVEATINKATQIDNDLAAEITGSGDDVHYYAYVIVNANGQVPDLTTSTTFEDFSNLKFNEIGSPIAEECNIGDGGLLMTNAPVCNYGASTAAPTGTADEPVAYTTLVELDKTKIFSTAALAETAGNQAACVYVERAAVKVTVSKSNSFVNSTGDNTLEVLGWQIINYEPTYFNTRKVEADWGELASDAEGLASPHLYRFVSPTAFAPTIPGAHTGPFRTYFAKDVQYENEATLMKTKAGDTWIDPGKSGYTTENTFDVEHQTWNNTTQIAIKAKFNGGTGFFVVDGNTGKLTLADAKTQLETNIKSLLPVQNAFQTLVQKLPVLADGQKYTLDVTVTITEPTEAKNIVEYTAAAKVMNGTNEADYTNAATEKAALDAAVTAGVASYNASYYLNGEAYYTARIKHFGDVETPWSAAAPWKVIMPGNTVQQIYGFGNNATLELNGETVDNSAKRFLGRYGVVRDNWYDIVIDGIEELGSAEPIDVNGNPTPDDEVKNFISVHVHIIPWVLRTQHISF